MNKRLILRCAIIFSALLVSMTNADAPVSDTLTKQTDLEIRRELLATVKNTQVQQAGLSKRFKTLTKLAEETAEMTRISLNILQAVRLNVTTRGDEFARNDIINIQTANLKRMLERLNTMGVREFPGSLFFC